MKDIKMRRALWVEGEQLIRKFIYRDDTYIMLLEKVDPTSPNYEMQLKKGGQVLRTITNPNELELIEFAYFLTQKGDTILQEHANKIVDKYQREEKMTAPVVGGKSRVIWNGGDRQLSRLDYPDESYNLAFDMYGRGARGQKLFGFSDVVTDPEEVILLEGAVRIMQYGRSILKGRFPVPVLEEKVPA